MGLKQARRPAATGAGRSLDGGILQGSLLWILVAALAIGFAGCADGPVFRDRASPSPDLRAMPRPAPTPSLPASAQRIQVAVYPDAPAPAELSCSKLLPIFVPAIGKAPTRETTCTIGVAEREQLEFIRGEGDLFYLDRVTILTCATASLPRPEPPRIPDCSEVSRYLLLASADPATAGRRLVCRVEPLPRGHVHDGPVRIWFLIPADAGVCREDIPGEVHCWELVRDLGPPRGVETFPVPCRLN